MCGRFEISLDADDGIRQIIETARSKGFDVKNDEIFPTDFVAVLIAGNQPDGIQIVGKKWGFSSFSSSMRNGKSKALINARQETVFEKPTFREHFPVTRCVFPTTGFYEWDKSAGRAKTLFRLPGKSALYLAGFYRDDECIILTTAATESFARVHERMPLILVEEDIRKYLHNADFAENYLFHEMPDLEGKRVSSVKFDSFDNPELDLGV